MPIDMQPWRYFLMLEQDFQATAAFVEPHPHNHDTFSDRYAGLLLLLGSEIDVVAKALSLTINPAASPKNMKDCCRIITGAYPDLYTVEIEISRYDIKLRPWDAWGKIPQAKPYWWGSYNDVKHDRLASREKASQGAVIDSLCGLFILLLYFYKDHPHLQPYPDLLEYDFPYYEVSEGQGKKLPGT